ncbi:STY4851/ECs_5259 family protein, partial [bacterium]|nr:STY4851/ECs_5259 family protein [bacterium]
RKLIRKARTEYLISLACEGGLPLRIVQRENTGLQRFFKKLLQKYADYNQSGISAARLAEEVGNLLPASLRTSEVFHLAGALVESVIDLKCNIPSDTAPNQYIEVLDRSIHRWRDNLPLNLDDEIASSFFNDLVTEVERIQTFKCQQIKFHRYLEKSVDDWELYGEFNIPNRLPFFYLKELFNQNLNETSRFYLALKTSSLNDKSIAKLAKQSSGDQVIYRADLIPKTNILKGMQAVATTQLVINSQDGFSTRGIVSGSGSVEDVPWILTWENEDKLILIRTGSYRSQQPTLYVAVPEDFEVIPEESSKIERVAELQTVSRTLYKLSGTIRLLEEEGTSYIIQTGAELGDIGEYIIQGSWAKEKGNIDPIYQGLPQLSVQSEMGGSKPILENELFWRSPSKGAQWIQTQKSRYGIIELAHIQNQSIYHKRRIGILPSGLKVEIQPISIAVGNIFISNLQGALVGVVAEEANFNSKVTETNEHNTTILFRTSSDLPPSKVKLKLNWLGGGEIILEVPFPTHGSCFTDSNGNRISQNRKVVIDQLYGVEALTVSQNENESFNLTGRCSYQNLSRRLQNAIFINEPFKREFRLITLKPRFKQIFAATESLDAEIKLKLEGRGKDSSNLRVSRFDIDLAPAPETDTVHLSRESLKNLTMEDLEVINLFSMPIADPYFEPVHLEQQKIAGLLTGTWNFNSQEKTNGAWMIFGHFNGAYHIRPRRWDVKNHAGDPESSKIYQIPDSLLKAVAMDDKERRNAYHARFDIMVKDPNHPDWDVIIQYIHRYQNLPLITLDLFGEMVQHSDLMAMLLLKYASTDFDRIWIFREELPFSWLTLPFDSWIKAADTFYSNLSEKLSNVKEDYREAFIKAPFETFFRNLIDDKKPFQFLVDFIKGRVLKSDNVTIRKSQEEFAQMAQFSINYQHRELNRKHADDQWPLGPNFKEYIKDYNPTYLSLFQNVDLKVGFRNGVLGAPIFAAIACIEGLEIPKEQIFAVKFLRDFDTEWFDNAYHFSLVLAKNLSSK